MNLKKRSTIVSLTTLGLFVALACSDIAGLLPSAPMRALVPGGTLVVHPGNMNGWAFQRGPENAAACSACEMAQGPGTPPIGSGSASMTTGLIGFPPSSGLTAALILREYKNTRLDQITDLRYANYRWPASSPAVSATKLEFVVDYDLNDQLTGAQGRIVYDPIINGGFTVADDAWQTWDARAGKWWGTQATVQKGGLNVSNPCVSSSPCTWTQLLAAFPNIGVHNTLGAVLFEAPPGSSFGVNSNVDGLVIGASGVTTTFDFELAYRSIVPMTAPDSVPTVLWDSLTASTNIITDPPGISGRFIRDLVYVAFVNSATQSDRQSAIDAVQGTVVGGMAIGNPEHFYAVRVPYVLQPGDSASGPILRAIATLVANSKVAVAAPGNMDGLVPAYRRPKDDSNIGPWALSPDSAFGPAWGPQAIDAPMAWGCSNGVLDVGQAGPIVAIVDTGFHQADDLIPNVGTVQEYATASDSEVHGTSVAGIAGARGNNQIGIAGMLWYAKLDLYNIGRPTPKGVPNQNVALFNINRAVQAGAQIINVSYGLKWNHHPHTRADSARARFAGAIFGHLIAGTRDAALRPKVLFVLAASNDTADAFFGGLATAGVINSSYKKSMMVVGGIKNTSRGLFAISDVSNRGSLVDVVAPGQQVLSLRPFTPLGVAYVSGTSFAAPFVTGLAGMLLTFDPTLSIDSVRALIIAGAKAGGRKVVDPSSPNRPLDIINAYQSLRLAATRTGGPLCGNRVYDHGSKVVAERGTSLDTIGSLLPGFREINVKHGGRRVEVYAYPSSVAYNFANGQWTSTPVTTFPPTALGDGGAYNSTFALTHDGDTLVMPRTFGRDTVRLFLADTVTYNETKVGSDNLLPSLPPDNTVALCDYERFNSALGRFDCVHSDYVHGIGRNRAQDALGVSSALASAFVAFSYSTSSDTGAAPGFYNCDVPIYPPEIAHCLDRRHFLSTFDSLQIYQMSLATGQLKYLASKIGGRATRIVMPEDGRELLLSYEEFPNGSTFSDITVGSGSTVHTYDHNAVNCVVVSIPVASTSNGFSLGTWTEVARESGSDQCPIAASSMGMPTFAPSRIPNRTPTPIAPLGRVRRSIRSGAAH